MRERAMREVRAERAAWTKGKAEGKSERAHLPDTSACHDLIISDISDTGRWVCKACAECDSCGSKVPGPEDASWVHKVNPKMAALRPMTVCVGLLENNISCL